MFIDREDAAHQLAEELEAYRDHGDAVVLAIPRGGLVTGAILASELRLPLEIILTKKIGHPENPEYAIGVANLHGEIIDEAAVARHGVSRSYLESEVKRVRDVLRERFKMYHGDRPELDLKGRVAIVCDDGVATGHTLLAALRLARAEGAARVVAAVPVGAADSMAALRREADETHCLLEPEDFGALSLYYRDFHEVTDKEAIRLLRKGLRAAPLLR